VGVEDSVPHYFLVGMGVLASNGCLLVFPAWHLVSMVEGRSVSLLLSIYLPLISVY
jgi:hypothetical protein